MENKNFLVAKQQMGIAALIMAISILISRFMGLIRDKVISWQFGASGETDLYFTAFVLPDFINYLLAGGYVSITIIPLLSKIFTEDENSAWKFFNCIFLWTSILIISFSVFAFIFAPQIVPYLAPGFNEDQLKRLTYFLRIILPAQIFFLPGACLSAILYIRKQFFVPALMPLIYNACILFFGITLPYFGLVNGMEGFCYGVLIGAFIGSGLMPYLAVKIDGIKWQLSLYHPKLKYFVLMALPLMIGQSIVILDEQFVRIFGSMAEEGAVSLLSYARRIMMVPVGVVAQAAAVASFPFLASLAAKKDEQGFSNALNSALSNSIIIIIPLTCCMIVLALPILGLIFEGGRFTSKETEMAGPLLQIMLLAVPFWAIQQIIGRAFYAREDTLTPTIIGSVITVISLPFYFYYAPKYGASYIALITSLSIIFYALVLLIFGIRKFNFSFKNIFCLFFKNILLCIIPIVLSHLIIIPIKKLITNIELFTTYLSLQYLILIMACGFVFLLAYLISAKIFMPENFQLFCRTFKKLTNKNK